MLPVMETGNPMSRASRWDYLQRVYPRYRKASRGEKQGILDEFCQLRLSPQACYPLAEPSAAGGETGAPATSTRPNLRPAHDGGSEVRLGRGRLSLVGTPEGLVAGVDALDSPPLPAQRRDRAATAAHQPAQHRLPPARGEAEV